MTNVGENETETLIQRACLALSVGFPYQEVMETLLDDGVPVTEAHLAVRAAEILARDREAANDNEERSRKITVPDLSVLIND